MENGELARLGRQALEHFILSASGWRTVFAVSGDEEDGGREITPVHACLAGLMARAFLDGLPGLCGKAAAGCCIAVAMDTRPTGPAIVQAMLPALLECGCRVRLVGVSAAPEIMAWARSDRAIDGFIYVSASHNPIGHNGVKFGLDTGGVINADQIKPLIDRFRSLAGDAGELAAMARLQAAVDREQVAILHQASAAWKAAALSAYWRFSTLVLADSSDDEQAGRTLAGLRQAIGQRPVGLVGDQNGSARSQSIDHDFLSGLGVKTRFINDQAGRIAHRIVPEGESLDFCREALARAHREDASFELGYMPDNDGDRGNLVYVDSADGQVKALEAQEVFALCCLAELAFLVHSGQLRYDDAGRPLDKVAIAVNDPTSLRIDELARYFGAEVFRAEVGEANVVNLAKRLRENGYLVRILGEGSNGGNITHPAAVRDPLNTITSMLKLLAMTGAGNEPGLFAIWCRRRGLACPGRFGLGEVIATLPAWTTTSAYEDRAILRIRTNDHVRLKAAWETGFLQAWEAGRSEFGRRFGIVAWEELNYEGTSERRGFGPEFRSGAARGGLRVVFRDNRDQAAAMVWMRGSGTEPVFRVAAEIRGHDPEGERWLLDWHKSLVARADSSL